MNYSQNYSLNHSQSFEKESKINPFGIGIVFHNVNLNRQNSTLSNRGSQQEIVSPGHIPNSIIGQMP